MQGSWSHRILAPLCTTALAIASIPTVFVPLEGAMRNWSQLSLGFGELAALLALPFALLAAALTGIGVVLVVGMGARGLAIAVALLIGLWIQSTLFVWDYGVFDGSPIDWSQNAGRAALELATWLFAFAAALVFPKRLASRATLIALLCIGVQLAAAAANFQSYGPFEPRKQAASGGAEDDRATAVGAITELSSGRNVIVIVLDTLQSDFFAELLRDRDFAASLPPGLRFYRNAVAPYPHTQHSLPSMLTAKLPAQQPPPRWIAAQMKESLPALLARQGWRSAVLTTTPAYLACNQVRFAFTCESQRFFAAASEGLAGRGLDAIADARSLLRIGAFRAAPHHAKAWVYDEGRWRVPDPFPAESLQDPLDPRIWHESRRDLATWRSLTRDARVSGDAPRFKFLHFFAAHHPSSIDADCGWNGLRNPEPEARNEAATRDRRTAVAASHCALGRAFAYLERLDRLGVYDDALVFIVGDHGRQHTQVDLGFAEPPIVGIDARAAQPPAALKHPSKGVPLLLVKRAGERGALRISDTPVSLCDLPQSIFGELALPSAFACESIFDVGSGRAQARLHFRGMDDYEAPFRTYRVDGHSWLSQSWKPLRARSR